MLAATKKLAKAKIELYFLWFPSEVEMMRWSEEKTWNRLDASEVEMRENKHLNILF